MFGGYCVEWVSQCEIFIIKYSIACKKNNGCEVGNEHFFALGGPMLFQCRAFSTICKDVRGDSGWLS